MKFLKFALTRWYFWALMIFFTISQTPSLTDHLYIGVPIESLIGYFIGLIILIFVIPLFVCFVRYKFKELKKKGLIN